MSRLISVMILLQVYGIMLPIHQPMPLLSLMTESRKVELQQRAVHAQAQMQTIVLTVMRILRQVNGFLMLVILELIQLSNMVKHPNHISMSTTLSRMGMLHHKMSIGLLPKISLIAE
jgi:hypothetical protein